MLVNWLLLVYSSTKAFKQQTFDRIKLKIENIQTIPTISKPANDRKLDKRNKCA